jgi:hypothetical protein
MSNLTTFGNLVNKKLKDDKYVLGNYLEKNDIYDDYIQEAIKEYSRRNPDRAIYTHVVVTGETNVFDLPSDWEEDFSSIINIEYPVEYYPPQYIDEKYYEVVRIDTGLVLRFIDNPYPGIGQTFWVRYTKRHSVTTSASTIPTAHEEAVANLSISKVCQAIANFYATTTDSSMSADVIDYQSKAAEYNSRSKAHRELYEELMPLEKTGEVGEWDLSFYEGRTALTHDRDHY